MRNGSYFVPREEIYPFFNPGAMKEQEGINANWITDPAAARRVLPPQFELLDPDNPVISVYVVNITEPTFAPWYMEAGMMMLCRYDEHVGVYFLNLQLSGPGAATGMTFGREFAGLPKKMCERIVVERNDDWAHALVESKGRRIFDIEVKVGPDTPEPPERNESSCFLFTYEAEMPETQGGASSHWMLPRAQLLDYHSVTDYRTWAPTTVESITMEPSVDDPWAELEVVTPLDGSYTISSNWVRNLSTLANLEGDEADALLPYLFTGRWDRSTISPANQRYGQF